MQSSIGASSSSAQMKQERVSALQSVRRNESNRGFRKKKVSFTPRPPRINSVLMLFDNTEKQIQFPLHLFILNFILCLPVIAGICALLYFVCARGKLPEELEKDPEKHYGVPGLFYCAPFIVGSLSIELAAAALYMFGSFLLLIGTLKTLRAFCYTYIVCTITSFLISATIRIIQLLICKKREIPWRKIYYQSGLPYHFNVLFIWLIAQLFWYLLIFSLVDALLKWWRYESFRKRWHPKTIIEQLPRAGSL